jgi:GNAT superfamily N-acetyltransferase
MATNPSLEPHFRRAHPAEADKLGEIVIAGVSHWGHHVNYPAATESLRADGLPTAEYVAGSPVFVLEDADGLIGFYGLGLEPEHVELIYLFLVTDRIGAGNGRRLWQHAVAEAARHGTQLFIKSDPMAIGFYEAMGASRGPEVEISPGFSLTTFTLDLVQPVDGAPGPSAR